MEEKKDSINKKETESYWNKMRDFNLSRTSFWISFLFELIETIIPFIVIWILIGADFKNKDFNFYNELPGNKDGIVAVVLISFLIWSIGIATITFFLKWQKADVFTYTLGLSIIAFCIIMNGSWMINWNANETLKILVRFLICLFVFIPTMLLGVFVTTFARNYNFKIEEEDEEILLAYKNGFEVPTKKQLRIEKAEKARLKRQKELEELNEFKKELDQKLINSFEEINSKPETKEEKRNKKLDAKEAKKRNKNKTKEIKDLD